MKLKAFTLAEVLVVIGIIGAVAAVTLPNLSSNTSDVETVAKVQRAAAKIQGAFEMAQEKYGEDIYSWISGAGSNAVRAEIVGKRIEQYMNVTKSCGLQTNQNCFSAASHSAILGSYTYESYDKKADRYKFITNDGMSFAIYAPSSTVTIDVDVDGPNKGYNKFGRDIFRFQVANGSISMASITTLTSTYIENNCKNSKSSNNGKACTDWILHFGNMDYVKCSGLTYSNITCK